MRSLARTQGIKLSQNERATTESMLIAARAHFRSAMQQEKGRLAAFGNTKGTKTPPPEIAESLLTAADVIDIATLKKYRSQHTEMPSDLRDACMSLGGGVTLRGRRLQNIKKALGVDLKLKLRYPETRHQVNIPERLKHTMLTTACIWKVRSWAASTLDDAALPSSKSRITGETLTCFKYLYVSKRTFSTSHYSFVCLLARSLSCSFVLPRVPVAPRWGGVGWCRLGGGKSCNSRITE